MKTTFVLGAGASVPYNFPDGRKLRNNIINKFLTDIQEFFIGRLDDKREYMAYVRHFINQFDRAHTNIDLFITRRNEFEDIGKFAICNEILKAEQNCNPHEVKANIDWYYWFFNKFTGGIIEAKELDNLIKWEYSFITFNYDRLLETYIQTSMMANWGANKEGQDKVNETMRKIPIKHVYGSLGHLNWETGQPQSLVVGFGDKCAHGQLVTVAKNIHVMHNNRGKEIQESIIKELKEADRVFFLGFSFSPENLEQIGIPEVFGKRKVAIYATAYGYTPKQINEVKKRLWHDGSSTVPLVVENRDCLDLLREYLD